MIDFTFRFITAIVFAITIFINGTLAAFLFLPALMGYAFTIKNQDSINWVDFFFSKSGLQIGIYLLVAISLYIGIRLLPEKWLPGAINTSLSIPLILITIICVVSTLIGVFTTGLNTFLIPNIISGILCAIWATRAQQYA